MRALAIAATGMEAQEKGLDVISNNIANIGTTGFKRSRAEFTDLLYQIDRRPGVSSRGNNIVPEGDPLGLGVKVAAIRKLHTQGSITNTGNTWDLALNGRGWFQITSPDGETLHTRAGALNTNANGQVVTLDGYPIEPAIVVPANTVSVTVSKSGIVSALIGGTTTPQQIGQLTLATFANDTGLEPVGSSLYRETPASGAPTVGVPGDPGFALIEQGYLEASNVDPVKEVTNLIQCQRAYEMNYKVIEAANQMESTVSRGSTS